MESRLFPLPTPQVFSSWGWTTLIDLILRLAHLCRLQVILSALFQVSHIGTQCCHWSFTGAEWNFVGVSGCTHQCTSCSSIFSPPHSSTSPSWGPSVTVEPFLTYSPLWVGKQLWFLPGKWDVDFSTSLRTYRTARCYINWWLLCLYSSLSTPSDKNLSIYKSSCS